MNNKWYVLQSTSTHEVLLECTDASFRHLPLPLPDGPSAEQQVSAVAADVPAERSPYEPASEGHRVEAADPRATHTVNDIRFEGNDAEHYLTRVAHAVEQAVGTDVDELYVAMDTSRASLFEAIAPLPVTGIIDGVAATPDDLWRISREQHAAR